MGAGLALFENWEFITVYWLSGFVQEKFEIWKGKKDREQPTPNSTSFTIYLLFPLIDSEESHLFIRQTASGLSFSIDWFPGEEFPLKTFASESRKELLLMSEFHLESVFLHLT